MFALSLVDFLSLLLSPSNDFKNFIFVKSIIWRTHTKSSKISCWFKIWMGFVGPILIKLWTSSIWGFFSCLCDGLLGVTYTTMLVTTQWPLKCAANLSPHLSELPHAVKWYMIRVAITYAHYDVIFHWYGQKVYFDLKLCAIWRYKYITIGPTRDVHKCQNEKKCSNPLICSEISYVVYRYLFWIVQDIHVCNQ